MHGYRYWECVRHAFLYHSDYVPRSFSDSCSPWSFLWRSDANLATEPVQYGQTTWDNFSMVHQWGQDTRRSSCLLVPKSDIWWSCYMKLRPNYRFLALTLIENNFCHLVYFKRTLLKLSLHSQPPRWMSQQQLTTYLLVKVSYQQLKVCGKRYLLDHPESSLTSLQGTVIAILSSLLLQNSLCAFWPCFRLFDVLLFIKCIVLV